LLEDQCDHIPNERLDQMNDHLKELRGTGEQQ